MSLKKRAVQGTAVALTLVMMSATAEAAQTTPAVTTFGVEAVTAETDLATNGTAGIVVSMNQVETGAYESIQISTANVSRAIVDKVATGEDISENVLLEGTEETEPNTTEVVEQPAETEAITESAEQETTDEVMTEEEKAWQNRLMADVNEFLYVRAAADENAEVVGKLYKGDAADIVETGDTWTHITSGNVDGYVNNNYCVTGTEALVYAKENFDQEAEILANGLRVRSAAAEDASVITAVSTGNTLTVDTDAESVDGWVAVNYGGSTGYVSADYVEVSLAIGEGVTIEEEQAALERAAAEAAAAKAAQITEVTTVQNESVSATTDEVSLLAAIIQCEAGNEVYEGQVAVGAVVMNRVRSGSYPSTVYDVIYQKGQFPPAGSGSVAKIVAAGPKDTCIQAAQEALNGTDNTGGATRFRRASSGHAGVVIGNHVFY